MTEVPNPSILQPDSAGQSQNITTIRVARWAILLVAVMLHGYHAWNAGPLWRDESNTVTMAAMPLEQLWASLGYDSFPLGYFLVVKAWGYLPFSALPGDGGWRLLGFVSGCAFSSAVFAASGRLGGHYSLGFLALTLLNPVAIRFGDSVRPYGLSAIAAVLACLFYWQALQTGQRKYWWLAFTCCLALMHLHYMNVVLLLGLCGAAFVFRLIERSSATETATQTSDAPSSETKTASGWQPVLIAIGVLASLVIYLPALKAATRWSAVPAVPSVSLADLGGTIVQALNAPFPGAVVLWCVAIPALAWSSLKTRSSECAGRTGILLGRICLGIVLAFLPLYFKVKWAISLWYLVPYLAVFGLAAMNAESFWAQRFGKPTKTYVPAIHLVVATLICAIALVQATTSLNQRFSNMDLAVSHLREHAHQGDLVVVEPWYLGVSFHYHAREANAIWTWETMPPLSEHAIHRYDLVQDAFTDTLPQQNLFQTIAQTLQNGHSVWVVSDNRPEFNREKSAQLQRELQNPELKPNERYSMLWNLWPLQLASELRHHTNRAEVAKLPSVKVMPQGENVGLYEFRGANQ